MVPDSLFSDAGWLFFAIWSIVIGALSVAAFGRDLLEANTPAISPSRNTSSNTATQNSSRKL
jgi:hypothetical protein